MSYRDVKVRDMMVPKERLITLPPEATIEEAAEVMESNAVGSVLIVREGRLIGIFTERDVVKAIANKIPPDEKLEGIMTKEVFTIREDAYLSKAALLISERNIRHLPVVDVAGNLVGIISSKDVAKYYSEFMESLPLE